jgi:ubiquitin carboxyl-terminal hydrolase 12/46
VAVVIHCGSGPNRCQLSSCLISWPSRGHYISIVKSHGFGLRCDDDTVDKIDPATIEVTKPTSQFADIPQDFYGLTADIQKSSETGYILFYQSWDLSGGQ